jgi:hypothetical protein
MVRAARLGGNQTWSRRVTAKTARQTTRQTAPPQPRLAIGVARRGPAGAPYGIKAVGSFVPRLTAKAFERFGFSTATLITDWPVIAGSEVATYSAPERLKWPRGPGQASDDGEEATSRQGAVLVLRVEPARALDMQYQGRQILERINAYFGYAAVRELRLVQAPVAHAAPTPRPPSPVPAPLTAEVQGVADPALRQALGRLGASIRSSVGASAGASVRARVRAGV